MAYTIGAGALTRFGSDVLTALAVPAADAYLLADSLVTAELWGHSSHGMLRLPWYVERLRSGVMTAVTQSETVVDSGALVVLDGHHGIGQVLTARGGRRRSRAGPDPRRQRGRSSQLQPLRYRRLLHPPVGRGRLRGVPLHQRQPGDGAVGRPYEDSRHKPVVDRRSCRRRGVAVMDIANTAVARGKIYLAAERGEPIPAGWAADENGTPTTDAAKAVHGLILPMAGHKGYVISFMMDVLGRGADRQQLRQRRRRALRAGQAERLRAHAAHHRRGGHDAGRGVRFPDGGADRRGQGGSPCPRRGGHLLPRRAGGPQHPPQPQPRHHRRRHDLGQPDPARRRDRHHPPGPVHPTPLGDSHDRPRRFPAGPRAQARRLPGRYQAERRTVLHRRGRLPLLRRHPGPCGPAALHLLRAVPRPGRRRGAPGRPALRRLAHRGRGVRRARQPGQHVVQPELHHADQTYTV